MLTAAITVVALSAADIPVVTPSAASIEVVKAVPSSVPLCLTICSRPSFLQRSSLMARQIKPLACVAIKFMALGSPFSAAKTRSPSFSLSSSSIRITILPCAISLMISWMLFSSMINIWVLELSFYLYLKLLSI